MTAIANFSNRHSRPAGACSSDPAAILSADAADLVPEEDRKILTYWAADMVSQGLSQRTIRERMIWFRRLVRETKSVLELSRRDLIMWMAGKEWSNTTRVNYRSLLHTFFTWLQDEEFRLDNPGAKLPRVKANPPTVNPFTPAEVDQLMNSGIYASTRAMVALHYYLGLRVSEIARVHGRDLNRHTWMLTTVGKGNKTAYLPVPAQLRPWVEDMPRGAYWFPNRVDNELFPAGEGHVLGRSVSTLLADAINRAGLHGHRPHQLRAATATQMHRAGVNAFTIQSGMRHTQMDTTNRYLLVDPEQVRDAFEQIQTISRPTRSGRRQATA